MLYEEFTINNNWLRKTTDIGEALTDEEGRFCIEFLRKDNRRYYCHFRGATNALLIRSENNIKYLSEDDTPVEYTTYFTGLIRENITNIQCDSTVILEVKRRHTDENFSFVNREPSYRSCFSPPFSSYSKYPIGTYVYTWRTLRDGEILTEERDSFYLDVGERKELTIEW